MSPHQQSAQVKCRAVELGFDACGVAEAGCVDPEDRLGAWLRAGFHAGMDWLAASQPVRRDIRRKLAGARSVIVVARNYYAARPCPQPGTGRVARYAWGLDYHTVLRKPLRALAAYLRSMNPAAACYVSVDTGPVLERGWAARAGLGWIGKNGLVVRQDLGSWLFLGVVATTVELEPDPPAQDGCGDCSLCVRACPNGAIVAPGVVDARRCIAYHTVENRGEPPRSLRPRLGRWVFGCDVCQEVCPWNAPAQETSAPAFLPREGIANPDLAALSNIDDARFNALFKGTAIRRIKAARMRRNATIALENLPKSERIGFPDNT